MEIKILGPGCPNCTKMVKEVKEVLAEMKVDAKPEKITDMEKIMEYDVFITPALVINGKVKVYGRIPGKDEIKGWIEQEIQSQ